MKKLILLSLISALPLGMMAQDDDMYFVPTKKNVEKAAKNYGMPRETYYSGSNRSVDDYNRRGSSYQPIDSAGNDIIDFSAVRGVYPDSTYSEDSNYTYTRKMARFDGYEPDEAYLAGYRAGRSSTYWGWTSPWYYNHYYDWYDPWYYGGWYGYPSSWYYGYYSPWYRGYYGYYGWGGWYGGYYPRYYGGGYYGGGGRLTTHHQSRTLGNSRNFGGYRSGTSFGGTRSTGNNRYNINNSMRQYGGSRSSSTTRSFDNNGSFGSHSNGSSFGGSRSSGGSFGGSRSSGGGGRSFGGRR